MESPESRVGWLRSERGVALIAVLGFLAVMSLLAITVVGAARTAVDAAGRHLARVQAQAAVESAVNVALLDLVAARGVRPAILNTPRELAFNGFKVTVSARPESAKIDLNFADVTLLTAMFREAGADGDRASALASAVMDWRDADDLLHLNGAEQKEYDLAGLGYGPANKPFETVEELRYVLGVSAEIFDCLVPHVTTLSQHAGIDAESASPLVRRAAGLGANDSGKPAPAQSVVSGQAIAAGEVFEIVARLTDPHRNIRRSAKVVARITGNPREPYWILAYDSALWETAERSCPSTVAAAR